jgi:hypothetical protein
MAVSNEAIVQTQQEHCMLASNAPLQTAALVGSIVDDKDPALASTLLATHTYPVHNITQQVQSDLQQSTKSQGTSKLPQILK